MGVCFLPWGWGGGSAPSLGAGGVCFLPWGVCSSRLQFGQVLLGGIAARADVQRSLCVVFSLW